MQEIMTAYTDMARPRLRERLEALLADRGMQPAELARRARVSKSTLSRVLSGDQRSMSSRAVMSIAQVLQCDPRDLAGDDVPPPMAAREVSPAFAPPSPTEPDIEQDWEVVDIGALIRAYLASPWSIEDRPTPEEMQWMASLAGALIPRGAPRPTAGTLHQLLMQRRSGKL